MDLLPAVGDLARRVVEVRDRGLEGVEDLAVAVLIAEAAEEEVAGDAEEVGADVGLRRQGARALEEPEEGPLHQVLDADMDLGAEEAADRFEVAGEEAVPGPLVAGAPGREERAIVGHLRRVPGGPAGRAGRPVKKIGGSR